MDMRAHFKKDRYAEHSGIEIVAIDPGRAVARMTVAECHMNSVRTVHGGAIFTLADFAFAMASNAHGTIAMGLNVSINYLRAVTELGAVLTATAREVSLSPRVATYTIDVKDEDENLVATFQGLVYRKKETIESMYAS